MSSKFDSSIFLSEVRKFLGLFRYRTSVKVCQSANCKSPNDLSANFFHKFLQNSAHSVSKQSIYYCILTWYTYFKSANHRRDWVCKSQTRARGSSVLYESPLDGCLYRPFFLFCAKKILKNPRPACNYKIWLRYGNNGFGICS